MKRKVCVITGSRADYGLLRALLSKIRDDDLLELQLIVTGSHLSRLHGYTVEEITSDGFDIAFQIECLSETDSSVDVAEAMSKVLSGSAQILEKLKPDVILVFGDRFEMLAAAAAAVVARVPIGHIHGGEVTIGAYDDSFRHAITKLASIHFVAVHEAKSRVIQLGEDPRNVHLVGGLGVDSIKSNRLLDLESIQNRLNLTFKKRRIVVTFHPTTLDNESPEHQTRELLAALGELQDTTIIFTGSNADTGGVSMMHQIKEFVDRNDDAHLFPSLGHLVYLSCLSISDGVVGNSSSGLLEAPSFKIGTINIGIRQLGRPKSISVIDSGTSRSQISQALKVLYSDEFRESLNRSTNPYGEGGASERILKILKELSLEKISTKKFFDVPINVL